MVKLFASKERCVSLAPQWPLGGPLFAHSIPIQRMLCLEELHSAGCRQTESRPGGGREPADHRRQTADHLRHRVLEQGSSPKFGVILCSDEFLSDCLSKI